MIADLHLHTNHSDGTLSVEELVTLAVKNGLDIIAITDHDTLDGLKEAEEICKDKIQWIPGTEITCQEESFETHDKMTVHILGYGIVYQGSELQQRLIEYQKKYRELFYQLIQSFQSFHMNFDVKDVAISCGNLMQLRDVTAYVRKNYRDSPDMETVVQKIDSCEEKIDQIRIPVKEAIRLIHDAGGRAVLAHPYVAYKEGEKTVLKENMVTLIINHVQKYGLDGIEAYYYDFSEEQRTFLYGQARERNMIVTSGSDFHGFSRRNHMVDFEITSSSLF